MPYLKFESVLRGKHSTMFIISTILLFACSNEVETTSENVLSTESKSPKEPSQEEKQEDDPPKELNQNLENSATLSDPFPEKLDGLYYEQKKMFARTPPVEPYRFNLPSGIAVDSTSGDFYVADTNNRVIQRYDAGGTFIKMWKCDPLTGVTVDPSDGSILIAVPGKKNIVRYDKEGKELQRFDVIREEGRINHAIDLTIHPNGRIFVLDKTSVVTEYNREGKLQKTWIALALGGDAIKDGGYIKQKYRSMSLSLSPDWKFLYVINSGKTKIQKYTLDGNFIKEWGGERDSTPGFIRWSRGITVNKKGEIIVADTDNERLQMFTSEGEYIRWFRGPHNEEKGIFHPRAVDVNLKTGKIYAAAAYSHRIDIFDAVGNFEKSVGGLNEEVDVLNDSRNITVDPFSGKVYASARRDHVFRRFSADGEPEISFLFTAGDMSEFDDSWRYQSFAQFPGPFEFDLDGNIWAIRGGYHYPDDPTPSDYLRKYDKDGNFLLRLNHESLQGYMEGLDIHRKTGDFYLTNILNKHVIQLNAKGELIRTFGDDLIKKPSGIAIDEKRNRVYVADMPENKVLVFSTDGTYISSIGRKGRDPGEFRFTQTVGLEVDDCGLLYVAEPKNRRISVFAPSGEFKAFLMMNSKPAKRPRDISVFNNRVYVVGEDTIQEFERIGVNCSK
jgi:DNA-binding beta-propeller fold protein YncE